MEPGSILLHLVVVLVAALLAAELAERIGVPGVLVEIVAGVIIGPSVLGVVRGDDFVRALGELGVILLLFEVGRQMDLAELARVGGASIRVAVIGVVAPMAAGYVAMRAVGIPATPALFLAAGITATSVGLTARVFGDLRMLASTEARTVLGAAVADDVIGLLVLTVVVGVATGERVSAGSVLGVTATAVGFVVGATVLGIWLVPRILRHVSLRARTDATVMLAGLAFALAVSRLASAARLAPIVGAFVAGLAVARSDARDDLHRRLAPIGHVLIPIFFLQIGIDTELKVFVNAHVLWIATVLSVVAIAMKLLAGLGISAARADRLLVGIGMIPRGEVGLIFAGLGLSRGILNGADYGALVVVVLATTLVTPSLLRMRSNAVRKRAIASERISIEPPGGWLRLTDDTVELAADTPPRAVAPMLALRAALACAQRRPAPELVQWLSGATDPVAWDRPLAVELSAVLAGGNERSWRFLELSGMLGVLLPDVARALARTARDPFDLDPTFIRLPVLARAQVAVRAQDGPRAGMILLAALARDAFANAAEPAAAARSLAVSVGCDDAESNTVAFLVGERNLLRAAAARLDMGTEASVLALAAHIGTVERARDLALLDAAENGLEGWERERIRELTALVYEALSHPDLTGGEASSLIEQRTMVAAQRLAHLPEHAVRKHLDAAPRRYLLAQDPAAIERHVRMLGSPLAHKEVRIHADPAGIRGAWTVHVVTEDRAGILSAITGAFADAGVSIDDAFVSTWRTGLAIDVFGVQAPPDVDWSAIAARAAVSSPAPPAPIEGVVTIDNLASPWHTIVEVQARDRSGLLHRVAAALADAGLNIDQAFVKTTGTLAVDTFWVTARGGKLDESGERRLREAFEGRVRRPFARLAARATRRRNKVVAET